jgi:hypothetical protein
MDRSLLMKVVHVLKRIETIDNDIKDLKKLEKSISRDKSFSTPIYISIEQQINILLAERVKLFELQVNDPPATLVDLIEGDDADDDVVKPLLPKRGNKKSTKSSAKKTVSKQINKVEIDDDDDDLPFRMLTQDQIDNKISDIKKEVTPVQRKEKTVANEKSDDESTKLLDTVLQKDSDSKSTTREKKRVRFFKDNFPGGEY